jgi:GTP-binding protein
MKPVVAIVGRPNVGKSTLFNRLIGRQVAIVSDIAGTTRDRIFAGAEAQGRPFTLVDTGGLEAEPRTAIALKVRSQAELAIDESDIIIFLLDVIDGLLPADMDIASRLRQSGKPVIVVVNKTDNEKLETQSADFFRLGLEPIFPVSALHGRGVADLQEYLAGQLPEKTDEETSKSAIPRLAIVGRPGVGKSTLLNSVLGKERAIVNNVPGTTRDAINTIFRYQKQDVMLIDTGGLRRRGRIEPGIEQYSVIRTLRAIEQCHVALFIIDASELVTAQDTHVARFILDARKGMVVVANKWDLVPIERREEYRGVIEERLKFLAYVPLIHSSAIHGSGIGKVLETALDVWRQRSLKLPDDDANGIIMSAYSTHPPLSRGQKRLEIYGATQGGVNPPLFVIRVNEPALVHFSYRRYLENRLRERYAFIGTPVTLVFKKSSRKTAKGARQA